MLTERFCYQVHQGVRVEVLVNIMLPFTLNNLNVRSQSKLYSPVSIK